MHRKYDVNDKDGNLIGTFEFDDLQMAQWLPKRLRHLKKINKLFKKYGLNPADLNPDGSGKTMASENAVEAIEADINKLFSGSPGNVDVFFKIRRPLAMVESGLYIGQVVDQIGAAVLDSLEKRRGIR